VPKVKSYETFYLGIDPGKSGGIVLLGNDSVMAVKMPPTMADVGDLLKWLPASTVCVLEKVWGHTGTNQPGSRMFNFGQGFGQLEAFLYAYEIPTEEVAPRTWQKALKISPKTKTESDTQWKNRLKAKAQQLFPSEKVTLATADALLIATYCKRKHEGTL
jgi:hypothetical protein